LLRKGRPDPPSGGGGGAKLGFRPEEDDGPDRWDPPVSGCECARAGGCGLGRLGRGEREGFWADFRPKAKRRLFKTFFNLNYFLKCNSIY
jgi:hypothetical protein